MSRCTSCDVILQDHELLRTTTIELEDGDTMEIHEDFCSSCLSKYVYNSYDLDVSDYQHESITENLRYILGINYTSFNISED